MLRDKNNKINSKIHKFDKKTTRTKGPTDRPPARRSVGSRWLLRKLHTLGTVHWDSAVSPPTTPQLASTSTMTYAERAFSCCHRSGDCLRFFLLYKPTWMLHLPFDDIIQIKHYKCQLLHWTWIYSASGWSFVKISTVLKTRKKQLSYEISFSFHFQHLRIIMATKIGFFHSFFESRYTCLDT